MSVHATTVAFSGSALALTGGSGVGKSGTAAQMIALGAQLVADDLTILHRRSGQIFADAPAAGVSAIELWGIGIVPIELSGQTPLAGIAVIGPSRERLPEDETMDVLGLPVLLLRHPLRAELASKLMIWLRARGNARP